MFNGGAHKSDWHDKIWDLAVLSLAMNVITVI